MEIEWKKVEEFPNYLVNNLGMVMNNDTGRILVQSETQHGASKVNLIRGFDRYTRSVAVLVAENFVEGRSEKFNTPVHINGDHSDNRADNLLWRPRWFAWKYSRQFEDVGINHSRGPIRDVETKVEYYTMFDAAVTNCILVEAIWSSILTKKPTFPTWQVFEFVK